MMSKELDEKIFDPGRIITGSIECKKCGMLLAFSQPYGYPSQRVGGVHPEGSCLKALNAEIKYLRSQL